MDRRSFLMTIGAALIPKVIRVNTPISGLLYYDNDGTIGTWNGITRSSVPQFSSFYGGGRGGGKTDYLAMILKDTIPKIKVAFERDPNFYGKLN